MDFEELVDRFQKPIYNLVFRMVGDLDEAADITQDTFVAAFRAFAGFRGESSAYTWLCRIAVNRCKNRFKQIERRTAAETAVADLDECTAGPDQSGKAASEQPHSVVERNELREHIERAIHSLPHDYRIVAVLRDLHGMSYKEIADVTGLGLDVVRVRLSRARDMVRKKLAPYIGQ